MLDNTDRPTEGPNTRRKRKLEDEVDMGPPKKVAKTGSGKKSERLAKKTPGDKPSKVSSNPLEFETLRNRNDETS